jgi:hypothetical protein
MWQLCGWGRVDICMIFHMRAFDFFIPLQIELTIPFTCHLLKMDQ